ncbi:hypothetical protein PN36_04140 [Candidatus Thiomargarita nelsonii]|uniref:Uncharacterized protein n=1 Tax=Candidatus Thiomargarita nelsonii TaxID=1003181 RepID=A0A0A6PB78_9GAMM|nr:hypothetical protein PN36_04140 [Candidatus Thiomargarita nelsonii]
MPSGVGGIDRIASNNSNPPIPINSSKDTATRLKLFLCQLPIKKMSPYKIKLKIKKKSIEKR